MSRTPRLRPLLASFSVGLAALLASSCDRGDGRKPPYPVRGQVFFQGKPAQNALVIFHPQDDPDTKTQRPYGRVQADGFFRLSTYTPGDGAPAGEYAVTILWPKPPASPLADPDMGPDLLEGRYADPKSSPFKVVVRESDNVLEPFHLK